MLSFVINERNLFGHLQLRGNAHLVRLTYSRCSLAEAKCCLWDLMCVRVCVSVHKGEREYICVRV